MDEKEVKNIIADAQAKIVIAKSLFNILVDELDFDRTKCGEGALCNFTQNHDMYADVSVAVLDYI